MGNKNHGIESYSSHFGKNKQKKTVQKTGTRRYRTIIAKEAHINTKKNRTQKKHTQN